MSIQREFPKNIAKKKKKTAIDKREMLFLIKYILDLILFDRSLIILWVVYNENLINVFAVLKTYKQITPP